MKLRQRYRRGAAFVFSLLLASLWCHPSIAQSGLDAGLDVFPNLSLGELGKEPAVVRATYTRGADGQSAQGQATLSVTAEMQPKWHVYSTTQPAGGPTATKITLTGPAGVKLLGEFKPDAPAKRGSHEAWPGLVIEEHYDRVTWSAPVSLPSGFDGPINVAVTALVCKTDGSCIPLNAKLKAAQVQTGEPRVQTGERQATTATEAAQTQTAAAEAAAAAAQVVVTRAAEQEGTVTTFRDDRSVVQWTGQITPAEAVPGAQVALRLTAKPDAGYHVYAAAVDDTESRTNFVVTEKSGLQFGAPQAPSKPIVKSILPGLPPMQYHEGEITWTIPITVGEETAAGSKQISGMIGYQACTDTSCLPPRALRFTTQVQISPQPRPDAAVQRVRFATAPYAATMDAAAQTQWVDAAEDGGDDVGARDAEPAGAAGQGEAGQGESQSSKSAAVPLSLIVVLGLALGGGLILNLMPCVLPVVGLKIMSFASQAGQDRSKILALNAAYTLGILVVFWGLAVLAIISTYSWGQEFLGIEGQLAWGQQFQFFSFRYAVILLVFALALSFLGVWEIPIPGFVGGKSTQQLQRKEGFSGAFFKGIFTTLLATPCSGPLLGSVFFYTLGKSAPVILAIFTTIGLGMALPYLLIAVFPRLIAYLPKPGAWMDTLKQLLGFLLLATVVFIFTFFPADDMVLVFASLIGVWFGCWIIGQVPNWETLPKRLAAWVGGIGAAAAACFLAFWLTTPGPPVLAWEPYDEARLQQLQREGRTVLVDFTASWCATCQINYFFAINTEQTRRLVDELNAVPMLADWSDRNESIGAKLLELDSNSIPVLAIYPGSDPSKPIVLRDVLTQGDVLTALREAGASVAPARSSLAEYSSYDLHR